MFLIIHFVPKYAAFFNYAIHNFRLYLVKEIPNAITFGGKFTTTPAMIESWRFFVDGLWWSGLRLSEALALTWGDDYSDGFAIELNGQDSVFRIRAEAEKGNEDRLLPVAPEFVAMLEPIPTERRAGLVFNPIDPRTGGRALPETVCRMVTEFGRLARVVVDRKAEKVKYASCHDLRRAFGQRWASAPGMHPQTLMEIMRHKSITTTLRYYVRSNARNSGRIMWAAYGSGQRGTVLGTAPKKDDEKTIQENAATPCFARGCERGADRDRTDE